MMTAILIARAGGPEVLQPATRPVPQPEAGQVLIKIAFAGVNRHDCGQRNRGFGPAGATDIPGLEVAGDVVAIGAEVTHWKPGDRVCALAENRNRPSGAGSRLAPSGHPGDTDHRLDRSPPAGCFRPCPHGVECAHRQDSSPS